jgi:murein DD-endopeptidase MepM/ murein hydrolase activator NlpD
MLFDAEPALERSQIPRMRLPFEAGVAVLCSQGNSSEPGRTHSLPQNRHALDFSNRILTEIMAVAASEGTVVYVASGVGNEADAGGGYGNQVRILHAHGLFTLYAHLGEVMVGIGQHVVAGQPLGFVGHSGLAGDRHLHFSLHSGVYGDEGVPPTLEIPQLDTFRGTLSSSDFRCGTAANPWSGEVYAPPAPVELQQATLAAIEDLEISVARRSRLHRYSHAQPFVTVASARSFLRPLLEQAPTDPVVNYAWAVEVEMPQRRFRSAEEHFSFAERAIQNPALEEPWILAWIENQRGAIAFAQSRMPEGEAHFARAWSLLQMQAISEFARHQRERYAAAHEGSARE